MTGPLSAERLAEIVRQGDFPRAVLHDHEAPRMAREILDWRYGEGRWAEVAANRGQRTEEEKEK